MSLGCKLILSLAAACAASAADLRVCADPYNLPYSNVSQQGFENELSRLIGRELNRPVRYLWLPQGEKYFKPLSAGSCDVTMEAPARFPGIQTTQPYYRSTYVFVSRRDRKLNIRSFDDARLRTLRIGIQYMPAENADAPPAAALAARGITRNITWYPFYQNDANAGRPAVLIDGIEKRNIDVAIAWGPSIGYFATRAVAPLEVTPLSSSAQSARFTFNIAMGVSPHDAGLAAQLNRILSRDAGEIRRILENYGVPMLPISTAGGRDR